MEKNNKITNTKINNSISKKIALGFFFILFIGKTTYSQNIKEQTDKKLLKNFNTTKNDTLNKFFTTKKHTKKDSPIIINYNTLINSIDSSNIIFKKKLEEIEKKFINDPNN